MSQMGIGRRRPADQSAREFHFDDPEITLEFTPRPTWRDLSTDWLTSPSAPAPSPRPRQRPTFTP